MSQFKAVVFDLLTALLDSWSVWDVAAGGTEPGRRWRARYLDLTYGCGAYRPYELLVAEAARDAGLPATAPAALHAGWGNLQPWPEAPGVLQGLKTRGLRLGVATNCSAGLGRQAAARCGVPFDAVVTSEQAGFYKPHPEPYRAVLAALDVETAEALFVACVGRAIVWPQNPIRLDRRSEPQPDLAGLRRRPGLAPARALRSS